MSGELAGRLSERVTLELWQGGSDDLGAATGAWILQGDRWASIRPIELAPSAEADSRSSRRRYQVTLRSEPRLSLLHRLRWRDEVLALLRVEADLALPNRQTLIVEVRP